MESIMLRSECIRKCKQNILGSERTPGRSNEVIEKDFEQRKPYDYLQYCYFKLDRMIDAASAAYTFYVVNSDNKAAVKNVQFYREKIRVKDNDFIDLELRPYKEHFIRAMMAYEEELWEEVVEEIEKSLVEFYKEEERCRRECEGPLLATSHLEFYSSITEHYFKMIQCQVECEDKLSQVFPEGKDELLAEHYHYLQFTYYKLGQADKASEAAASYLYIIPEDEVMLRNQKFFIDRGYEESFTPRQETVEYVNRKNKLEAEIKFFNKHHKTKDYSDSSYDQDGYNGDVDTVYDKYSKSRPTDHYMKRYEDIGLKIVANGNHLNGSKRFASDGFLKDEQCSELKYMIEDYYNNENGSRIISIKDLFEKFGENQEELEVSLRLLLRSSEISRHYMMKYHNLTDLYFKHTVVTCWEVTKDSHLNRTCLPQEDGNCIENQDELPDQSELMSVMYLNDMKDGDLYFLDSNKTKYKNVSTQCGRLVGLTTDDLHNVTIPTDEMRCAIVIKYTTSKKEEEKDYIQTQIALQLFENEKKMMTEKNNVEIMKELEKNGTRVSLTSEELSNSTAFVADGLATENDCLALQHLVQKEALSGDGYDYLSSKPSVISPHTEFETFIGLTVLRAASLAYHRHVTPENVLLFLNLAEKGRFLVEKYFNLTRPLYFDFTHLVCRTAIEGEEERDDLSHPVHADNCILQPDGTCIKSFPAFTQRDYSAILYLNDEFEGGDFFFADSDKTEKVSVRPKCGRLVGFDSKEFHGVKAVTKGQRCALALWFTMNPNYKELAHVQARKLISRLEELVPPSLSKDTEQLNLSKDESTSESLKDTEVSEVTQSDSSVSEGTQSDSLVSEGAKSESIVQISEEKSGQLESEGAKSDSSESEGGKSEMVSNSDKRTDSQIDSNMSENPQSNSESDSDSKSDSFIKNINEIQSDSNQELTKDSDSLENPSENLNIKIDFEKPVSTPKINIAVKVERKEASKTEKEEKSVESKEDEISDEMPKLTDEL